jgi:hypothetical protein
VFVQDFVRIDRPLNDVIEAFEQLVVPRLGTLVHDSWSAESGARTNGTAAPASISVGPRRIRSDGVVYAISWPGDGELELPEFDADLELASLTPTCTHLELTGQSLFPAIERWSNEDRRANRKGMAALASLLSGIAATIEAAVELPT